MARKYLQEKQGSLSALFSVIVKVSRAVADHADVQQMFTG